MMNSAPRRIAFSFLLAFSSACSIAHRGSYKPSGANLEAREWFQDAKFGLFIQWGVYSLLGQGAGVMDEKKMTVEEYEIVPQSFNPARFSAEQWVGLAKFSGARYVTITSKDRDGFAMFDSRQTSWDVVDGSPFQKDVLKGMAKECDRQGMKLFLHYSQLDWHHPDYFPRGATGRETGRPESGEWSRYLDFMDAQVRELLSDYGSVGGIRLDGSYDKPKADWRRRKTYDLIHRLQPRALVGNNHRRIPFSGEDFQILEQKLPDPKSESRAGKLPLELYETMNDTWGINEADQNFKSTRDLLRELVRAAGNNANFLLGVSPRADGSFPPECAERLREMGNWLEIHGESIYGTRGGPLPEGDWGVSTHKENKIYLHLLSGRDGTFSFSRSIGEIAAAYLFSSGAAIDYLSEAGNYTIRIPGRILDPLDTIIVLEMTPTGPMQGP